MSTTICRIPVLPFVNKVKAGQTGPPGDRSRRNHAAISSCHSPPRQLDPSTVTAETMRDIGALNKEMMAAGVRFFAGGQQPETKAKSLRAQPNGQVLITDGPYLEAKEHVGGFWILQVADLDEALAWGRKAVVACRTPVEVRPFFEMPPSK